MALRKLLRRGLIGTTTCRLLVQHQKHSSRTRRSVLPNGLLDGRLFCIFIHRHLWGECPHLPHSARSRVRTAGHSYPCQGRLGQHPSRPRRCHMGLRPMYSRRRTCADRKYRPRWDRPGRRQFRGLAGASGGWLAALAADSPWPPPAIYGHLSPASTSEPVIRVMAAPGTSRRRLGQHPSCRLPDESGRRLPPSAAQSTLPASSDVPVGPVILSDRGEAGEAAARARKRST